MNQFHPLTSRKNGTTLSSLIILAAICVLILIPTTPVKADVGLPHIMHFYLEYEIPPVSIVTGNVIGCSDASCSTNRYLEFGCGKGGCSSGKYDGWEKYEYYRLVITFSDKIRESDVFTRRATLPQYFVTVKDDSLFVRESSYPFYPSLSGAFGFIIALPLTLFVELIVTAIVIDLTRKPKFLVWVLLGNIITLPIVWFAIPLLNLAPIVLIILAELFAVTFEALFLYFTNKTRLSFKQAGALSLLMNGLSFISGELLNRSFLHLF